MQFVTEALIFPSIVRFRGKFVILTVSKWPYSYINIQIYFSGLHTLLTNIDSDSIESEVVREDNVHPDKTKGLNNRLLNNIPNTTVLVESMSERRVNDNIIQHNSIEFALVLVQ